jgi:hypothetical protein
MVNKTREEMLQIQEEAKRRFPIGCKYKDCCSDNIFYLRQHSVTYNIVKSENKDYIYAHSGGGKGIIVAISSEEDWVWNGSYHKTVEVCWDNGHNNAYPDNCLVITRKKRDIDEIIQHIKQNY